MREHQKALTSGYAAAKSAEAEHAVDKVHVMKWVEVQVMGAVCTTLSSIEQRCGHTHCHPSRTLISPNSFLVPHSHWHLHWFPTCLESKPSRLCIRTLPHQPHPCPPFTLPPYWFLFSCPVSLFVPLAPSPFLTHMKLHALHVDYHRWWGPLNWGQNIWLWQFPTVHPWLA